MLLGGRLPRLDQAPGGGKLLSKSGGAAANSPDWASQPALKVASIPADQACSSWRLTAIASVRTEREFATARCAVAALALDASVRVRMASSTASAAGRDSLDFAIYARITSRHNAAMCKLARRTHAAGEVRILDGVPLS